MTATWPGRTYALFTYERLRDVRLVYAPPRSLGGFGGDADNFEWPRHAADFALLRVYAAGGAPYAPRAFLRTAPAGAADGDAVFLLGFPGHTMRYAPSARLAFARDVAVPAFCRDARRKLGLMADAVDRDGRVALKVASYRKSLANELKRSTGKARALARVGLVAARAAEEAALAAARPDARPHLDGLADVYARLAAIAPRSNALAALRGATHGSALLECAHALYDAAIEHGKPEAEREARFRERNVDLLAARLAKRLAAVDPGLEAELVRDACCGANWGALYPPVDEVDPPLDGRGWDTRRVYNIDRHDVDDEIVGRPTRPAAPAEVEARRAAAEALPMNFAALFNVPASGVDTVAAARKLVDSSPLLGLDAATLREMLANPRDVATTVLTHGLTMIVEGCYGTYQGDRDETRALLARRDGLAAALMDEVRASAGAGGEAFYPDCNGTLRVSVGRVAGYAPADAVAHGPRTTLAGLLDKFRDAELALDGAALDAFTPPARLVRFLEDGAPAARATPVNLLYSTDTVGGNSGSPVLDRRGRFVAINFDRQRHGLVNEFKYDPNYSRSIGVDVRYLLWLVGAYDGATTLVAEILRGAE